MTEVPVNGNSGGVVRRVARWLTRRRRHSRELDRLRAELESDPRDAKTWVRAGIAVGLLGAHGEAEECFERALKLDATDPVAWGNLGIAMGSQGAHGEAVIYFDEAVRLDAQHHRAWLGKGTALLYLGQDQKAVACLYQALAVQPTRIGWQRLGVTLEGLGRFDEALKAFQAAEAAVLDGTSIEEPHAMRRRGL